MDKLSLFLSVLESKSLLPKNIEVAEWNGWTLVSCFDSASSNYISESVRMGIDRDRETAFMKALTEHCERILSRNTPEKSITTYGRSDGFAAFPVIGHNREIALIRCRENAHNEAIERFLWANWWDNKKIKFSVQKEPQIEGLDILIDKFNLEFIHEVQVLDSSESYCLSILLAKLNNGGYVTGGACSKISTNHRYVQSYGELLRHLIVVSSNRDPDLSKMSFYEKRLFSFARGNLNPKVEERLSFLGDLSITLPILVLDKSVDHEHSDIVCLHRCYFQNQPIFMGGDIERLCI